MDDQNQRYEGRPLLRLLDCYILALTGNLHSEMEEKVAQTVRATYLWGRIRVNPSPGGSGSLKSAQLQDFDSP